MKNKTLPKQLRHWIKKAGLKFRYKHINLSKDNISLVGHGFFWRIISHTGMLCRSCKIENFDRWSNSEDHELFIGKHEKDFIDSVNKLRTLK